MGWREYDSSVPSLQAQVRHYCCLAMAAHSESESLAGDGEVAATGRLTELVNQLECWRRIIPRRAAQPLARKNEKKSKRLDNQNAWTVLRPGREVNWSPRRRRPTVSFERNYKVGCTHPSSKLICSNRPSSVISLFL